MPATLRADLFGRAEWEELTRTVDVVADCENGPALLAHPRRREGEVLVTSWGAPQLTREVLDELPSLRTVVYAAGSIRRLVSDSVWERGLVVTSAAEVNNEPVAEFVYAQTVLALKDAHRRSRHIVEKGEYPSMEAVPGIYRQNIGLVSFGSTARKAAHRLHGLESEILAWDPYQDESVFRAADVIRADGLPEMVSRSRVLSIHTPLIPGRTEKLITGELLRLLPEGATLINTARGGVIDEEAMIEVLFERPDLFAVLDVTTKEPPAPGSPLYTLPNVMLTGHVAGTIGGERRALGRLAVDELRRIAHGLPPRYSVSAEAARTQA
ncbi:hydroxyacid dehydrogenase [Streptomyces sp. N2-109]|uniref:Hydroxyacid dehydrogenase n=1 Tax=Streptomyces gossypii TaxID=2883101 RepID=A0ABT2JVS7_9ACTN|nr:hydroxyacid dehydrogenase [Streptomyces gossypii]MCT2591559.1 hydroxyacid dehydrogenase [Streptomyces gossypii]